MSDLAQTLNRLYALIPRGQELGLPRMQAACARFGNPEASFQAVHVAGTNGKGTVCAFVASMARAGGHRVGMYTSPHLLRFAERIQIDGSPIDDADLVRLLNQVLDAGPELTFFEVATLTAFLAFREAHVDLAVIEVGLGGRLDATNVIDSTATALTSVGLDHVQFLGPTELDIAREKLAVLHEETTLVTGRLDPEIAAYARRVAAERGAELIVAPPLPGDALPGPMAPYLERNAAVAAALAATVTGPLADAAIAAGLAHAALPGRAEMLDGDPPAIADAAHNEAGARALAEALPGLAAGRPVFGCLSVLADKDAAAIAAALAPALERCVCTAADPGPAMGRPGSAAMGAADLAGLVAGAGIAAEVEPDPAAAIARTSALAREHGGVALFAGSHYLLRYVWNARHAQSSSR